MTNLKTIMTICLVITLALIPFVPTFRVLDLVAPQYLYLSITQFIIAGYLLTTKKGKDIGFNLVDISYVLFLLFGLISFLKSYNLTESIIEWSQFLTLFITYFNLKILFNSLENKKKVFLLIFLSLAIIESLAIFSVFIQNYSWIYGLDRLRELSGLASNQNIGAFSLLIKVPIVLFLYQKSKKSIFKIFLGILFSIIVFDILVIASRAAIIGLILTVTSVLIFEILKPKDHGFKFKLSVIFSPLLILIFIFQSFLYTSNETLKVTNRITNYNDESVDKRVSYFKSATNLFLKNPIAGVGIGNWKIVSIDDLKEEITEYQVPYHTHNDLLQIASEIGIFGFLSFFFILFTPIIYLLKNFFYRRELNEITPFLLIAFMIYFWDSNINFPRIRPYSQMNFIFILSFFSSYYQQLKEYKVIKIKNIMYVFIALLLPLNFVHSKVFISYENMTYLYYDFNENQNNLEADIEVVKEYQDTFPNINTTVIPLKIAKANYYLQNQDYLKAQELIKEGQKHNPFLGLGDLLMSKIYYIKGQKDSALYYIESAYNKIPLNSGHVALYQTILDERDDKVKEDEIFERTKTLKTEILWTNHFLMVVKDSSKSNNNSFTEKDKKNIKEAIDLFPGNKFFISASLIINKGSEAAYSAIDYDKIASNHYRKKEYLEAIKNWNKASKIINAEDSYILNIALSYNQLKDYSSAVEYLKVIENRGIKSKTGLFEFVAGYSFIGLEKLDLACKYLKESKRLGYNPATYLLKRTNCQSL